MAKDTQNCILIILIYSGGNLLSFKINNDGHRDYSVNDCNWIYYHNKNGIPKASYQCNSEYGVYYVLPGGI